MITLRGPKMTYEKPISSDGIGFGYNTYKYNGWSEMTIITLPFI